MTIVFIIISFLLEGIFTNLVSINSLFIPLFTITSLVILFPYFNNKDKYFSYFIISVIFGFLYDIFYTNSLFINTFAFALNCLIIMFINNYVSPNLLIKMGVNVIVIIFYRITTYFMLCLYGYIIFNENLLLKGIYSSIIVNLIYGIILYFISNLCAKKLNIKKYE